MSVKIEGPEMHGTTAEQPSNIENASTPFRVKVRVTRVVLGVPPSQHRWYIGAVRDIARQFPDSGAARALRNLGLGVA